MNTPVRTNARWIVAGAILLAISPFCGPNNANAQVMSEYSATPPFIADTVPPNVLLLMDNSGSMNNAAYPTAFDTTKAYFGVFDPYECYVYGTNKFNPDPAANPAALSTCTNASYPWSGNLLNYAANRRMDIVKWVMVGGMCDVGRGTTGDCSRVKGQDTFDNAACCLDQTQSLTVAQASGRMPAGLIPGSGSVYFHMMGSQSSLKGSFCVDNDNTQPSGSNCADGDGYNEQNFLIRAENLTPTSGVIQQVGKKARFGLMEFKGAGDGGKVLSDVGGNVTSMVAAIDNTTPSTWTPLAESLYEATRYFAQIPPAYTNSDYSHSVTNRDPYYFQQPEWADTSAYVPCCKSFVIVFTDGESTQDLNVPNGLQDYAHAFHGTHCTSTPTTPCAVSTQHKTDYDSSGTHYLDDVAYYAHTTDLRQGTLPVLNETGKDLTGFQNLTVYTFYAFGQPIGRELLKTAAKTGGFEDRNGNNQPDLVEEYDKVVNDTGAAGADGLPDTYFESADADDLKDKLFAAITSILQRSASGTAVSVLATSSTGDGSLYQSFFYPLTYEGTREVKWTGYTQGLFLDTFGNLREDTNADGRLIYNQDKIVRTRFDTATNNVLVDRYHDNDGDGKADDPIPGNGIPDAPIPYETVQLREMNGIWEAGKRLALMSPANRTILTWVDLDNDGLVDSGEQLPFTTANSATLSPYLRAGAAPYTADNIINFIRGTQVTGLRDRELTVNGSLAVWKYGDPIHSTPTIIGTPKERFDLLYGDATYTPFFQLYRNRRQVAYVGSNDGMMHAFNGGFYHRGDDPSSGSAVEHGWYTKNAADNSSGQALGDELWGFIPYQLLPHLKWLTQANYSHVYYVDLKPKVTDVKIFCGDATSPATCINGQTGVTHPGGWGTILIGGFRMGGSCGACVGATGAPTMTVNISGTNRSFYTAYFALDITDPEAPPKLLWSFSSSDLGLSTSYPAVVRTSPKDDAKADHTNAKWFVVFGSGVAGYGGEAKQASKLFAVNLVTGPGVGNSLVTPMAVGVWDSFMADPITLDKNLDFRSDTVYVGRTIDPADSVRSVWSGKMYRLTMGTCASAPCSTSTWGIANGSNRVPTEVLDTFPSTNTTYMGPIVSASTVTLDDAGNTWIFFGTGRYFSTADKTNADTQYFFGVKDSVMNPSACGQTSDTSCLDNDLVNVSSAQVCVLNVGTCGGATNQVTGVTGVTTFSSGSGTTSLIGLVKSKDGWYTTLPAARERVLVNPTLIGGIAFFPSFIPDNNICAATGSSNLYALFYLTGSAATESIIGLTPSGSNQIVNRSMSLGTGLAAQMAIHLGSQGSSAAGGGGGGGCQSGMGGFINTSSGNIAQTCANTAVNVRSRYVAWINQRE